jgi:hypothetical protein
MPDVHSGGDHSDGQCSSVAGSCPFVQALRTIATGTRQTVPVRGEDPWATPDLLGEAPHVLRMSGTPVRADGALGADVVAGLGSLWLHVVNAGGGWLEVAEAEN